VDVDRQAIEKRDFPIVRRGYDPAAVDAHLRALAAEIEELQRASRGGAEPSLAATAGTQVQSILQAAETAAADIEQQAQLSARNVREAADRDAARTREEAVATARTHVAAVAHATSILLDRVGSMDGEVRGLAETLKAGASRLAGDLAAVETNMGELYDAASGRGVPAADGRSPSAVGAEVGEVVVGASGEQQRDDRELGDSPPPPGASPPIPSPPSVASGLAPSQPAAAAAQGVPTPPERATVAPSGQAAGGSPTGGGEGDLDGARLVALNMALNGESRVDAERYLAENFQLVDRQKLVDEVYAAIEA